MKLIKVNGNTVATAVKTKSGVFNMQLGINEYSDESLDRFIKYLKVYGTVEVVSDGLENVPDKHQNEPTRVFRRQFILSHATLADSSNWR